MRISLMALLLLLSTSIVTASVYENGDTNTRLTWEFTLDGELKIEGIGDIPHISMAPWAEYQSDIKKITIGEGITSFTFSSFEGCSSIVDITLPSTLDNFDADGIDKTKWYEDYAESVIYISNWLIGYRGTIEPNGILSLRDGTIGIADNALTVGADFDKLSKISLPNSLKYIGDGAFYGCRSIKSIIIPENVVSIGGGLFESSDSLAAVTCNALVPPAIVPGAFGNNISLNIHVPYSVVNDYKAAENWNSFINIQPIKEYESWISDNQGKGNSIATKTYKIIAPIGAILSFDWNVSSELSYDKLIVTLDDEQLLEVSGEQNGTFEREISQGVHTLVAKYSKDNSTENGMDQASLYNIKIDAPETAEIDGVFYMSTSDSTVTVLAVDDTTEVVIPASVVIYNVTYNVTDIKSTAFSDCPSLTTITITDGVTEIKSNLFDGCEKLTTVTLPNTLLTIGSAAFKDCSSLENITIPNSVTSIGDSAFEGCTVLKSVVISNNVTSIASRLFYGCTSLSKVNIPAGVTYIGSNAFQNCESMQEIIIPKFVTSIGTNAFTGCGGELSVNCEINSYYDTSSSPFYNSKFTKVIIGQGVRKVGSYAFYSNSEGSASTLTEVVLPNTLTYIERYAFYGTNLSTIELPAGIDTIGYNALPYSMPKMVCNAPTPPILETEYMNNMPSLGNISLVFVPQGCGQAYKSVYPWSSKVIIDGSGVSVNVTVTPGMMGEEILTQANYLADVNFLTLSGTVNDVDIANIKNSMPNLVSIDMSGLDLKSIPNDMFWERKAMLSIILPDNVEAIGAYTFHNCINLESIVLPEGLKRIESGSTSAWINNQHYGTAGSFSGCLSLKSILFPSTLEGVGNYAFYGCNRLQKAEFKEGTTSIGSFAFANCTSLNDIILPNTLVSISEGAFSGCSNLRKITIPDGVTSLGSRYESSSYNYGVFESCYSLRQVILPRGLKEICQRTFYGCSSLTTMDIPEGVTFIGRDAFNGCSNLLSVSMPSTLASCGSTPFANCNKLSEVKCLALLPPMLADGLLTLENMGLPLKRTLKVPEWTINRYKLTSGWAAFTQIEPIKGIYPSSINVTNDAVLTLPTGGLPVNYRPDMLISANGEYMMDGKYNYSASLHLRGSDTLKLNRFTMTNNGMEGLAGTQLLNEAQMEADSVSIRMYLNSYNNGDYYGSSNSGWYFLSFPFDVKISDITTNCEWVVRQYDGKARANNKLESTWMTVPQNATLNAGQGYIWACTGGSFTLYATDNANKSLIFANKKRDIPLQEYLAESISNSSWNLVGNPFPCYYNTNEMDFTAPITVWENNTYVAYSPIDDNYILRPFEAFFVQCPSGVKSIGFKASGRQLTRSSTSPVPRASPSRIGTNGIGRQVINLTLSSEFGSDRTRIVVNDAAKMDYELQCDAAKFMSNDVNMPQLFSVNNGDMFAINERPMDNGVVKLGTHFGVAGTYTIRMQSTGSVVVMLIDNRTGEEVNITNSDYTFTAETNDIDRFEIRMYANANVTAVEPVVTKTNVSVIDNVIVVSTFDEANVELYTTAGSLIDTGKGQYLTFEVLSGTYIVKVNGESHKVTIVK